MIALYIILILLIVYIVLIIGPALLSSAVLYLHRFNTPVEEFDFKRGDYAPFEERILADCRALKALPHEEVSVFSDEIELFGDYYDQGAPHTVLMVHGYSADPYLNFSPQARWFYDRGYNLLLVRHRAHPVRRRERSTLGVLEQYDVLSWLKFLEDNTDADIVVYGVSMGATAVAFASDKIESDRVKAMILDCGYVSVREQLGHECVTRHLPKALMLPWMRLFGRLIAGIDINRSTTDSLKHTHLPAFFLQGESDRVVYPRNTRENYRAAAGYKEKLFVRNAHHTLSFLTDERTVTERLSAFLDRYIRD